MLYPIKARKKKNSNIYSTILDSINCIAASDPWTKIKKTNIITSIIEGLSKLENIQVSKNKYSIYVSDKENRLIVSIHTMSNLRLKTIDDIVIGCIKGNAIIVYNGKQDSNYIFGLLKDRYTQYQLLYGLLTSKIVIMNTNVAQFSRDRSKVLEDKGLQEKYMAYINEGLVPPEYRKYK
jgi:hypothetical protein